MPFRAADVAHARGRLERADLLDRWLTDLLPVRPGLALAAVGGLGRCEPGPYSDLDLILLHDGLPDIAEVADSVWYPIWDSGLSLDHSVRSAEQARRLAGTDAIAGLGMLDVRHIAGDQELVAGLQLAVAKSWRSKAGTLLPLLRAERIRRGAIAGDTAYLVEPDLKEGRGGTRDFLVLRAFAAAQLCDAPAPTVVAGYRLLLDVRDALHQSSGRRTDVLVRQEQLSVMAALGLASPDELLRVISNAARTISFALAAGWRRVTGGLGTGPGLGLLRRRGPARTPLLAGVIDHAGEVVLARDADPAQDAVLPLRVAVAAAESGHPISPATMTVLLDRHQPLPDPWPHAARSWFVRLLAAGSRTVDVFEAFDQSGLLTSYLPEWQRIRGLPQRHPAHLYTVDRHLIEAAAMAAELTRRVRRPDLLLIGALLHDIGKGGTGDHCAEGAEIAGPIARRMGFDEADVDVITLMVGQHLLLPHTALRRDPADPATIGLIIARIGNKLERLTMLQALSEADARATGPGVWSPWRAHVIGDLVEHVAAALEPDRPPPTSTGRPRSGIHSRVIADAAITTQVEVAGAGLATGEAGRSAAQVEPGPLRVLMRPDLDGFEVSVDAADQAGLLSQIAGVLALHQLEIRHAAVSSSNGRAHDVFAVRPLFGRPPEPSLLAADLRSSMSEALPLGERLAARDLAYRRGSRIVQPTEVIWYDDAAEAATVVEVRADDRVGLLYRLTSVFEEAGIDILSARVETFGADAIDVFYLPPESTETESVRRRLSGLLQEAAQRP